MDADRSIIILGASPDRSRFANKALRAWRDAGWRVYPVNPSFPEVEGERCYPSIREVPGPVGTLNLYVRPAVSAQVLAEAAEKGIHDVYVNPGAGSPQLVEQIASLGMHPIEACSIVALGRSPAEFPD